jgi:hypothetical protein
VDIIAEKEKEKKKDKNNNNIIALACFGPKKGPSLA